MSLFLTAIIVITAFLALYWVFYGQRKYNEMLMPKRKTELKAILFDLDGVIIDSFDAWFHTFNELRRKYKLREFDRDEFRKNAWGTSYQADAGKFFKNIDAEEVLGHYKKIRNNYNHKTKLLPDAKKVLDAIKKKNIRIGLASNSFKEPALETLKFHRLIKYFSTIVTAEDVERPKPYPDAILKACEKLGVAPDEAIYVGDNKNDYKAGKSAGCFVVGLNTKGDLIISQLKDLLQLL